MKSELRAHDIIIGAFAFSLTSFGKALGWADLSWALGLLAVASTVFQFINQDGDFHINKLIVFFFLTIIALTLPILTGRAVAVAKAQEYVFTALQIAVMLYVFSIYLDSRRNALILINCLAFGYLFSVIVGHFLLGLRVGSGRAIGLYNNANSMGAYSLYIMLLLRIGFWLRSSPKMKAFYITLIGLSLYLVYASLSRKIILVLFLAFLAWGIRRIWISRWRLPVAIVFAAILTAMGSYILAHPDLPVVQRFTEVVYALQGKTVGQRGGEDVLHRLEFYRVAWSLFKENPIIGLGGGAFYETYFHISNFTWRKYTLHSTYFDMLVNAGLLGILPMLGTNLSILVPAGARMRRSLPHLFLFSAVLMMMFTDQFATLFLDKYHWLTMLMLYKLSHWKIVDGAFQPDAFSSANSPGSPTTASLPAHAGTAPRP